MINEPGTNISYDKKDEILVKKNLPTIMSIVRTIRDKQKETVDIGSFKRVVNNTLVTCSFNNNITNITIAKHEDYKEIKKKEKIVEKRLLDVGIYFILILEKNTQRKWNGVGYYPELDLYDDFVVVIAGGKWNPKTNSLELSIARPLTRAEFDIYLYDPYLTANGDPDSPCLVYGKPSICHDYLISLLPELGVRGSSMMTASERINTGVYWIRNIPYDLYEREGPKYVAGMGDPYLTGKFMYEPISSERWLGNKYYQEYAWCYAPYTGHPAIGSGDSVSWDVGTANDFLIYDNINGHDWRIDGAYFVARDDFSRLYHINYGSYSSHEESAEVYDYGIFAWITRYGMMFNGYTLKPGMSVNSDVDGGPQISDRRWNNSILSVQPWLVEQYVFDSVALFCGVNLNYSGRPGLMDLVDCYGVWNLRGCCSIYNTTNYKDLESDNDFNLGIAEIVTKGIIAAGSILKDSNTLPSEMFEGFGSLDSGDFRDDLGLVICDKAFVSINMYTIPTAYTSKIKEDII